MHAFDITGTCSQNIFVGGTAFNGGLTAVLEVVYMRKVGVRDENYPLKKFYVRWVRFCV